MPAASDASSSVATGRTSCLGSLSGSLPGGTMATGGSQRSATKNTATSNDAMTNSGIEMPAKEVSEIKWSVGFPARTAASTPSPSDSGIMSSAVIAARMNEFLSGPEIRWEIGACVAPCARATDESPRFPCTNPPSQWT